MSDSDEYQACHEPAPHKNLESCVREAGHDGLHWFWNGVNVSGGRKSAVNLYEIDGERIKSIAHGDFDGRYNEDCAIFTAILIQISSDPSRNLSDEENAEYERCQQSVIDARKSAERNEGQRWIG